jgi:protein ImuB
VLIVDKTPQAASFIAFAEACQRFSPKIAIRQDEAIFIDLSEPDFARARLKILALANRFGFEARVAFAGYASMAFVRARGWDAAQLPIQALVDYACPFEISEEKEAAMATLIRKLSLLGVRSVTDFLKLPPGSLLSRFGKDALEIAERLRGAAEPVWPMFRAPERVGERMPLEDGGIPISYDVLESLLFVLKGGVDRAMARLRGRGERAAQISVEFEFDERDTGSGKHRRKLRLSLPVAQGSAAGLLPILRDRLAFEIQMRPFPAAVTALSVEVLETVPGRASQKDFFQSREQEAAEALEAVTGRLVVQLGDRAVFAARSVERHRPESGWQAVPLGSAPARATGATAGDLPERPLRLLAQPILLREAVRGFLRDPQGKVFRTTTWDGPERISGEWWKSPFQRDYFRVVTESGQKLWVYSEAGGRPGIFHLHGYFD